MIDSKSRVRDPIATAIQQNDNQDEGKNGKAVKTSPNQFLTQVQQVNLHKVVALSSPLATTTTLSLQR